MVPYIKFVVKFVCVWLAEIKNNAPDTACAEVSCTL